MGERGGGLGGRRQGCGVTPGSQSGGRSQLRVLAVFVLLRFASSRRLLGARRRNNRRSRGGAGLGRHAGCLSSHFSRGRFVLHPDPAGGCRWLREGKQRGSVLEEIWERGRDLCVGLAVGFTPLQQVGSGSSGSVRTGGEDLGDGGGGRRGGKRGRMGDGHGGFGFGVGRRGRGRAW